MDNYKSVKEHLEFLGYILEEKELTGHDKEKFPDKKQFLAKIRSPKSSFFITYLPSNGFNFLSSYHAKPTAKEDKLLLLELLNKMTLESYLCSFVASEDLRNVYLLAWCPDYYSKTAFGIFLDRIDNDIKYAISHNPAILNFIE